MSYVEEFWYMLQKSQTGEDDDFLTIMAGEDASVLLDRMTHLKKTRPDLRFRVIEHKKHQRVISDSGRVVADGD